MLKLTTLSLLLLLLNGCTSKEVYIKSKPYTFQKTVQPTARTIRIYKEDEKLYNAYIRQFRNLIDFHNEQIDGYNRLKGDNNVSTTY